MSEVLEKPSRAKAKSKAVAAPVVVTPALTLGQASDKIWQLREDKRALDKQVTKIETEIKSMTEQIFEMLDAQDTRKAEGRKASISVNEAIVANTTDWTAFMQFVAAGKRGNKDAYLHMVQHRVNDPAFRELLALNIKVPGLEAFTKRSLSITSL